ncbi:DUF2141 domain-containing protein [Olleya sp. YSTF-M6]|uniref:DUF2141 domain-containing protein n=1 Tax=Olleya sediminilitoris TaxID=2795739 RepID=A0ABS1WPJ6_9FLAO|nr:DUF2141 domain-containing protein [Olleya sediminilitoris]MBL7561025.1 DUF2141 domain-containing protein [Olleya sediminilitoris]
MKTTTSFNQTKTILLNVILFFALSLSTIAQTEQNNETGQTITVTVNNVKNNTGQVIFGLHNNQTWMKTQGIQNTSTKIENNIATVTFKNVKPGTYAVMVLHDENINNRMDFKNGMPLENYGMTNTPLSYGPPQYSDAKFEVTNQDLDFKVRF